MSKEAGIPCEDLNCNEGAYKELKEVSITGGKWIKNLTGDKSGKSH